MTKPKVRDLGFDGDGHPMDMDSADVRAFITRVLDSPESQLVAVVLRYRGDLFLQVTGPPSVTTLHDLQRVFKVLVAGYEDALGMKPN